MKPVNSLAALRDLSRCLRDIRSTLAWEELVREEMRRGTPPSFRIDHHIDEDLRYQTGFFLKTATDLHEVLNTESETSSSEETREALKEKLKRLEEQLRKLKITDRLIKA